MFMECSIIMEEKIVEECNETKKISTTNAKR
jgi:hypothetical protein